MTIAVDGDAWTIVTSTTLKSMSKAFKVGSNSPIISFNHKLGCWFLQLWLSTASPSLSSTSIMGEHFELRSIFLFAGCLDQLATSQLTIVINTNNIMITIVIMILMMMTSLGWTLRRRLPTCETWKLVESLKPASSSLSKRCHHHHHHHHQHHHHHTTIIRERCSMK